MLAEFSGKIWENGEFGIAICKQMELPPAFIDSRTPQEIEDAEWSANLIKVHGVDAVLEFRGLPPLGFSPLPNSHKEKIRGRKGITGYGKRILRNSCFRMESEIDKKYLTFATFTLPNCSRAESLRISENWAEITRIFIQRLRRNLLKADLPAEIVGATEIQEERSFRDGILGLHLHLVFVGRRARAKWAFTPLEYRQVWKDCISRYLDDSSGQSYNWSACENIQRVKKSLEGYLGKYLSKGAKSIEKIAEEFGSECLPTAWHTITRSLRERAIQRIRTVKDARADRLLELCLNEGVNCFVYRKPIQIDTPSGRRITVGWMGKIKTEYIAAILEEY